MSNRIRFAFQNPSKRSVKVSKTRFGNSEEFLSDIEVESTNRSDFDSLLHTFDKECLENDNEQQKAHQADSDKSAEDGPIHAVDRTVSGISVAKLPGSLPGGCDTGREREQSHLDFLPALTNLECESRNEQRVRRLLVQSRLPLGKNWKSFQFEGLPMNVKRQLDTLREGSFLERRENVLILGRPGSGKSHALCALAEQLVRQVHSMMFTTCRLLVQQLLIAKRDLRLSRLIKQLSKIEGLIIDDVGYVQQGREEMEVLFTLLAERYERGSVLLTSNLAFSKWDQIFKDARQSQRQSTGWCITV